MSLARAAAGLRKRVHRHLDVEAWGRPGLSPVNRLIVGMILLSVVSAVLETEITIAARFRHVFDTLNTLFIVAFSIEYVLRVWISGEKPEYKGFKGRIRYALSIFPLIDLIVILAFFGTIFQSEMFLFRVVRLARIASLAKLGRYSDALRLFGRALRERRHELILTLVVASFVLFIASSLLYLVEGAVQPEAFGSIPRAMWWAVATLTTVGYGDVYPLTSLGRVIAGITALAGVGLIAMPAGVLAAAFGDAYRRQREGARARDASDR